jgi:hypothetical protein
LKIHRARAPSASFFTSATEVLSPHHQPVAASSHTSPCWEVGCFDFRDRFVRVEVVLLDLTRGLIGKQVLHFGGIETC